MSNCVLFTSHLEKTDSVHKNIYYLPADSGGSKGLGPLTYRFGGPSVQFEGPSAQFKKIKNEFHGPNFIFFAKKIQPHLAQHGYCFLSHSYSLTLLIILFHILSSYMHTSTLIII